MTRPYWKSDKIFWGIKWGIILKDSVMVVILICGRIASEYPCKQYIVSLSWIDKQKEGFGSWIWNRNASISSIITDLISI